MDVTMRENCFCFCCSLSSLKVWADGEPLQLFCWRSKNGDFLATSNGALEVHVLPETRHESKDGRRVPVRHGDAVVLSDV